MVLIVAFYFFLHPPFSYTTPTPSPPLPPHHSTSPILRAFVLVGRKWWNIHCEVGDKICISIPPPHPPPLPLHPSPTHLPHTTHVVYMRLSGGLISSCCNFLPSSSPTTSSLDYFPTPSPIPYTT